MLNAVAHSTTAMTDDATDPNPVMTPMTSCIHRPSSTQNRLRYSVSQLPCFIAGLRRSCPDSYNGVRFITGDARHERGDTGAEER